MINICLNSAAEPYANLHHGTVGDVLRGNYVTCNLIKPGVRNSLMTEGAVSKPGILSISVSLPLQMALRKREVRVGSFYYIFLRSQIWVMSNNC
jgi:hypothetical protein